MDIIKTKSFALRVHPAGVVLVGLAVMMGHGRQALCALLALLMHEGFHLLAIGLLGARVERVELTPFGGVADVESFQSLPASFQVCIALSGVLGSLLCYFALRLACATDPTLFAFQQMNGALGLFNLLPVLPMDGARALGAIADHFSFGKWLRKAMMGLAFFLAATLLLAAVYGAWHGHINVTLLFVAPYLCYAARQAYVSQRMQLVQQALDLRGKLSRGKTWKVEGRALRQDATQTDLLRALLALPSGRLHYFFFVNPDTGKVGTIWEEREAIQRILGEEEDAPAAFRKNMD